MLKGLSLQELAQKVEENSRGKRDVVADTAGLEMIPVPNHDPARAGDGSLTLAVPGQGSLPILDLAHDQIGARTGIPAKYYDRMRKEQPHLLAQNVNTWFHANPEKRMIRTLGGNARAFLSNRYQRIENEEILAAALPVLSDLPGVRIVSAEATERRLYLQFVVPTIEGEVKKGDVVQAGGILSNSEVGLGSCSVAGLIWRLWCLNGAKSGETFRKNHIGRKLEDGELGDVDWSDDTKQADDKAVLLKVRDMMRSVVDETRFRATLGRLQGLTVPRIEGDPAKSVEVLSNKIGANEQERGGILRALIEGGDLSAWGIVNAVTAQAHNAGSYDRAVEFEAAGGTLIDLPASQWKEVLTAGN